MTHEVEHRTADRRFVVAELGHEAYLEYYELPDGSLDYAHTYTPNEIRGRGIASSIIKTALDFAKDKGKSIVPGCPFVQTYIDRHTEYASVLAEGWKGKVQKDRTDT